MAQITIDQYLDEVPENRKERVLTLHRLILEHFPKAVVSMKYKMPTYELSSGWTAIANQKSYVSLYTCGAHHLETFKQKHPKIKTGKGCINFKDTDDLPLEDISAVIQSAMMDNSH